MKRLWARPLFWLVQLLVLTSVIAVPVLTALFAH